MYIVSVEARIRWSKDKGNSMKAVLLAGGLGTRMREETEFRPKPMVEVGGRPVLWHIMKILSQHGITDFIVCTGYKSEMIANYFLNFNVASRPFTVNLNSGEVKPQSSPGQDNWNVTVVDTGELTPTGGRIKAIEEFIGEEDFFVSYGDGLADVDITQLISTHRSKSVIATLTAFQPESRFGVLEIAPDSRVMNFREKPKVQDWINIGYFVFNRSIFDHLDKDSVLEEGPLRKLAESGELQAHKHNGFWEPMDTFREYQHLQQLWETGSAPWKTWS
jgi:glucose-1-phosphate cytidylyltransferase